MAVIRMAHADLAAADLVLPSVLEAKRPSQVKAKNQLRCLTASVRPVPAQDLACLKAFENTIPASLIFSGLYLIIAGTVSIPRAQVSS